MYYYDFACVVAAEEVTQGLEFEEVWDIVVKNEGHYEKCLGEFMKMRDMRLLEEEQANLVEIFKGRNKLEEQLIMETQRKEMQRIQMKQQEVPS